jgi:hypothetical protein
MYLSTKSDMIKVILTDQKGFVKQKLDFQSQILSNNHVIYNYSKLKI